MLSSLGRAVNAEDEAALVRCIEEDVIVSRSPSTRNTSELAIKSAATEDLHRVAHRRRLVVNFLRKFYMDVLLAPHRTESSVE